MSLVISAPKLVILGRQGAGKGTQAARLATHYDLVHLSTGDLLRAEVRVGSPLGRRVRSVLDRGELVSDQLMLDIVRQALADPETVRRGFLLDGFPRTLPQAEALLRLGSIADLDAVIDLDLPAAVARQRILARRVCPTCGTITMDLTGSERVACPRGDGWAVRRSDDTPEAIDRRLGRYDAEAAPIQGFFDRLGLRLRVDATGTPDEVFERVVRALRPRIWGEGLAVG